VSPSVSEERRVRWRVLMEEEVLVIMLEYQVDIVSEDGARRPAAGLELWDTMGEVEWRSMDLC
jgi:hypothetical protein